MPSSHFDYIVKYKTKYTLLDVCEVKILLSMFKQQYHVQNMPVFRKLCNGL